MPQRPPLTEFPVVSPTDIATFEQCPKQWHTKRILRDELFKFQVTEAITHGNVVHEQLEHYIRFGKELPANLQYMIPFFDGLRAAGFTLYAELECAVTEAEWRAVGWWDKTAWLRGKVDLIAIKDGEAIVFDYKTGKRKPDPTQLKIYALFLRQTLGIEKIESCYLWLKTDESDKFTLTNANYQETLDEITGRVNAIRDAFIAKEFPTRTGPLCGWCPLLDTCKEAVYYKVQRDQKRGRFNK